MKIIIPIAIGSIALVVFLILTHSHESRPGRWLKIAFSVPLISLFAFKVSSGLDFKTGAIAIFIAVVMAFVWRGTVAQLLGDSFAGFFYSDISSDTGIRPSFRYARNHRRDGEMQQAIAAIERELRKDPKNFEGLVLLAGVYQDMKQPENALVQLEIVSNNPDATEPQKEVARAEKIRCEQLKTHLAVTQGNSRR